MGRTRRPRVKTTARRFRNSFTFHTPSWAKQLLKSSHFISTTEHKFGCSQPKVCVIGLNSSLPIVGLEVISIGDDWKSTIVRIFESTLRCTIPLDFYSIFFLNCFWIWAHCAPGETFIIKKHSSKAGRIEGRGETRQVRGKMTLNTS